MSSSAIIQSAEAPSAVDAVTPLLTSAALIPLDEAAWLRVTGDDRVRWLNGMATNSIQALTPGHGCYTFFLNAQGRILGDATAFLLEDSILLETSRDQLPTLLAHLEHFIIMDDVELSAFEPRPGLLLAGPQAFPLFAAIDLLVPALNPLQLAHLRWRGAQLDLIHAPSPLTPTVEIWADGNTLAAIQQQLLQAGAQLATPATLEQLRILSGTPRFGSDIRNSETARDLPQETTPFGSPSPALHFSKGCYLGQEIVERIRSRGSLHRTFSGFVLTGDLPAPGTALFAEDTLDSPDRTGKTNKPIGELTSISRIELPGGPVQLALGYLRREMLERGSRIQYTNGIATPSILPFPFARI